MMEGLRGCRRSERPSLQPGDRVGRASQPDRNPQEKIAMHDGNNTHGINPVATASSAPVGSHQRRGSGRVAFRRLLCGGLLQHLGAARVVDLRPQRRGLPLGMVWEGWRAPPGDAAQQRTGDQMRALIEGWYRFASW